MRPTRSPRAAVTLIAGTVIVATVSSTTLMPAGAAAPSPASRPAAGGREALADGQVTFVAPAGWTEAAKSRTPLKAAYVSPDRSGAFVIEVLAPDADIDQKVGEAIVRKIREMRKQAKATVIMEPKLVADARFLVKIHEKYKQGDKTADVVRVYRQVGPRVVMATISALAATDADAVPVHAAGEQAVMSAEYVKPVEKGPGKKQ